VDWQALILIFSQFFPTAGQLLFCAKWCILKLRIPAQKERFFSMLTLRGIITILVLAGLFALAVVWISKQGGWKGEGCGGNCASCHQHCDTPEKKTH